MTKRSLFRNIQAIACCVFLICALIGSPHTARAQEHHPYKPMLGDSNWWTCMFSWSGIGFWNNKHYLRQYSYTYFTQGTYLYSTGVGKASGGQAKKEDVEVIKYHKLYVYEYNKGFLGYIREDTAARKVYYRPVGYNGKPEDEILLYNFSLKDGDTFFMDMRYIEGTSDEDAEKIKSNVFGRREYLRGSYKVHTELIDDAAWGYDFILPENFEDWNEYHGYGDTAKFRPVNSLYIDTDHGFRWIEGVGSLRDPLYIYHWAMYTWDVDEYQCSRMLICAGKDGVETFHHTPPEGCEFNIYLVDGKKPSAIADATQALAAQLSLSPGGERLFIQSGTAGAATLQLYDMSGRLVHSGQITLSGSESTQVYTLPVPLQPGIYIGSLQAGGRVVNARLISNF